VNLSYYLATIANDELANQCEGDLSFTCTFVEDGCQACVTTGTGQQQQTTCTPYSCFMEESYSGTCTMSPDIGTMNDICGRRGNDKSSYNCTDLCQGQGNNLEKFTIAIIIAKFMDKVMWPLFGMESFVFTVTDTFYDIFTVACIKVAVPDLWLLQILAWTYTFGWMGPGGVTYWVNNNNDAAEYQLKYTCMWFKVLKLLMIGFCGFQLSLTHRGLIGSVLSLYQLPHWNSISLNVITDHIDATLTLCLGLLTAIAVWSKKMILPQ
jgi:hypothetical protein